MDDFAGLAFTIVIFTLILTGYWTFSVFPRQREFNKRQKLVRELAAGDEVITFGGIVGRVVAVYSDQGLADVEVADGVVLRVVAASLVGRFDPDELARNAKMRGGGQRADA